MNKFQPTVSYLQQSYPAYIFDWEWLHEQLLLDLAHIQLIRDFHHQWPEKDPVLLLTLLFLVDAVNRGSLCLLLSDHQLNTALEKHDLADATAHMSKLKLSDYTLSGQTVLMQEDDRLYFSQHHHLQQTLQHDLSMLLQQTTVATFADDDIKHQVENAVAQLPYELEPQQIQALLTAVVQPFSIISGGPGTGKTTILLSLLQVFAGLGVAVDKMALAAPTGRAANRMTESIQLGASAMNGQNQDHLDELSQVTATTIHRLLGMGSRRHQCRYHENNQLPYDLVVIDEVSMVDLRLMTLLIQAVGPGTRLILLGDQFQLPSVQSGAILADLMPPVDHSGLNTHDFLGHLYRLWPADMPEMIPQKPIVHAGLLSDKVTLLKVSKRCEPHIASLSEAVRQGQVAQFFEHISQTTQADLFKQLSTQGGARWIAGKTSQTFTLPLAWFDYHYLQAPGGKKTYQELMDALYHCEHLADSDIDGYLSELFLLVKSQRILTLTHAGPTGTRQVNEMVAHWLRQTLNVKGEQEYFHGAVIMVMRNDPTMGLYNGDVGVVLEVSANQFQVYFESESVMQSFSVHLIPQFQLAFAMTVHKSQGSEFNHVLMLLTEQKDHRLLTREIIYTGMTRAKQSVCFYGAEQALKKAISNKTVRHSGLTFWYNSHI